MSNPVSGPGGVPRLTIGELADRAGKRPSLIRYEPGTVRARAVIDTAQRAGLTLGEIKTLLSASPDDEPAIDKLREVADRKLPEITALIQRAELVRNWLESAARCECPNLGECPLFDDPPLQAVPRQQPRPSPSI